MECGRRGVWCAWSVVCVVCVVCVRACGMRACVCACVYRKAQGNTVKNNWSGPVALNTKRFLEMIP